MILRKLTRSPRTGAARFAVGMAIGLLAAAIICLTWLFISSRNHLPRLTEADYQAAAARWETHGPADYKLDIEVFGNRPGKIQVEVHGGEVTKMVRDGVEPKQKRTWYYWSVPGMLDTIGQELEKVDDPVAGFHAPSGSKVILRARFDPKLGYPVEYHRVVLGSELDVRWQVMRFEALPPCPEK